MKTLQSLFGWIFSSLITAALISLIIVCWTGIRESEKNLQSNQERIRELKREIVIYETEKRQLEYELKESGNPFTKVKYNVTVLNWTNKCTELARLQGVSVWTYVSSSFQNHFFPCLKHTFLLILFVPILWKLVMYYGIAAIVERFPPVKPKDGSYEKSISGVQADVSLNYSIFPGEKLYLRAGDWGKKRSGLKAKTKFFWNWRFPLVSIVSDLVELVEFSCSGETPGKVAITSPEPDLFIGMVRLDGASGIVIRPRYLIGVTDGIRIRTRWSFNPHNLISGRARQIILYGSGTVFVVGSWGVDHLASESSQDSRIEENLTLGYETKSEYSLCRTETFWHYLRGSASLFDLRLQNGSFLTQNNAAAERRGTKNGFERIVSGILNGVGSFLGF